MTLQWNDEGKPRQRLLIGGTASVLGEDSHHNGDLEAQLRETAANLRALTHPATDPGTSLGSDDDSALEDAVEGANGTHRDSGGRGGGGASGINGAKRVPETGAGNGSGQPLVLAHEGSSGKFQHLRVYYRQPKDRRRVQEFVEAELPNNGITDYFCVDICRDELLVEIEGVFDPQGQ